MQRLIVRYLLAGLVAATCMMVAMPADAQRAPGALGIGGQVGSPSGVTFKVHNPETISYDFLAAWDLDDFFFLNVHGLYERPLEFENTDNLEYFFGPGAFVGFQEERGGNNEAVFGISGSFGLNFLLEQRFELYVHLTPRINLIPDTTGRLGGGLGLRYYF